MALSMDMREFCDEWLHKAESYSDRELRDHFNKAFSLWTVYNRLYCEATFTLAREGVVALPDDRPFPDGKGAKHYGPQFVGEEGLLDELEADNECQAAIARIEELIDEHAFNIKLSMPFGEPQRDKDEKLLKELRSANKKTRLLAIMDVLYSVRCNMVHGNKRYSPNQVHILKPFTTLLRKVCGLLYDKLTAHIDKPAPRPAPHAPARRPRK